MKMTRSRRSSEGLRTLVLLYLPTYSPWLNPAEMLWRALPPECDALRVVREHQGAYRRNPGLLPALQCAARPGALDHRLQCRIIIGLEAKLNPR